MNCDTAQRILLASERPQSPLAAVQAHLATCRPCRTLQARLVRLERGLSELPLPSVGPSEEFLSRFLAEEPVPLIRTIRVSPFPPPGAQETGRRKLALAAALAASLAIFAIGWGAWSHGRLPDPPDPLAQRQAQRQQANTRPTAPLCLRGLADLADQLLEDARGATSDPARLRELARLYRSVLREDLPRHASALPPGGRSTLVEIADRCNRAESEMSRLAADRLTPAGAADSLRVMAQAAHQTHQQLRDLLRRA